MSLSSILKFAKKIPHKSQGSMSTKEGPISGQQFNYYLRALQMLQLKKGNKSKETKTFLKITKHNNWLSSGKATHGYVSRFTLLLEDCLNGLVEGG